MTVTKKPGYRGYIASRAVRGETTPQHVQNLVIRDYAAKQKITFLLSATEYAMPACYMMLSSVLEELDTIEGIILFSVFMLPKNRDRRLAVYKRILDTGSVLHTALEGIVLRKASDISLIDDMFLVDQFSAVAEYKL